MHQRRVDLRRDQEQLPDRLDLRWRGGVWIQELSLRCRGFFGIRNWIYNAVSCVGSELDLRWRGYCVVSELGLRWKGVHGINNWIGTGECMEPRTGFAPQGILRGVRTGFALERILRSSLPNPGMVPAAPIHF